MAVANKAARQFQALFDTIPFKATVNFASAGDNDGSGAAFASADITVTGAALGDAVPFIALGLDSVDVTVTAAVTAANTVTVTVNNPTVDAVDLVSTTVTGCVYSPKGVFNSL